MSLDCIITVKGHGKKDKEHANRPRHDKTGPISDFICGMEAYYSAIYKHVKTCPKCDPEEILQAFLKDRQRPKLGGFTSRGLMKMAIKYYKTFPGREKKSTIEEYAWRNGDFYSLSEYAEYLSPEGTIQGLKLIFDKWVKRRDDPKTVEWIRNREMCDDAQNIALRTLRSRPMDQREIESPYIPLMRVVAQTYDSGATVFPDEKELLDLAEVLAVMET